jgi:hypothetical protein
MAKPLPCPTLPDLENFLLGQVAERQAANIEEHLTRCKQCLETVHGLKVEDTFIQAMRQAPALEAREPDEEVLENLIERFSRLADSCAAPAVTDPGLSQAQDTPVAAGTALPAAAGLPVDSTQEVYDFLLPPEGPGELGRLGPYRVLKVLGVGGMGVVFEAEDLWLRRLVALKVMRSAMLLSGSARRRFLREAQASAGIESEHIVTILQVGEDRGVPYLAMQLLQGQTLEERLKCEAKLPLADVLHIVREIAAGLAAAHERGLIHRDIKPANIWLETIPAAAAATGPRYRVKILDFGLARAFGPDAHLTQSGIIVGTPAYMAPEQAQGGTIDPRTDLFSLGCVLYRLCTGRVPFQGANTLATLRALELEQPKPPHLLNPAVPLALSSLIMKLLAKRRHDRFASAQALMEALEAMPKEPARFARPMRFLGGRVVLAATVALCTVGIVVYLFGPAALRRILHQGSPVVASNPQSMPSSFALAVNYAVGSKPYSVAVADFNGDGKQDLVISNISSNTVSLLLGNGDGTFQSEAHYATGVEPHGVAVGDWNGDGKPDLAVANLKSDTVSILLGNVNGTFQPAVSYAVGKGPRGSAVGDFNGDGKADLVVTNSLEGSVSVLLGNGDGTFQAAANYRSFQAPISVVVADVNGDGKPDLVASNSGADTVSVLLGNGDGSFRPANYFQVGSGPGAVVVADFNGDGKPDIVVENFGSDSVSVLLGNGDGTFQTATKYGAGWGPGGLAVGDFNGDGRLDLVVANHGSSNLSVLLGNGDGTFGPAEHFAVGWTPVGTAVGDFNGDGRTDVVVANHESHNVSVLLNQPPAPHFRLTLLPRAPGGTLFRALVTALDAWNRPETSYTGTVRLTNSDEQGILWQGDGTFKAEDHGVHELVVIFKTLGAQTLTVTDSVNPARVGNATVVVIGDWGLDFAHLRVETPAQSEPGKAFTTTVSVVDGASKPITNYTGTVHFTATDALAELPGDYTFQPADRGVHAFGLTLKTGGKQTLTVTDTVRPFVTDSVTVIVGVSESEEHKDSLPPK